MTTTKEPKTEMVTRAPESLAQPLPPASSMFEVIARASTDPKVDVDKLERLLAMQEKISAQERRQAFKAALAELQAEIPQIDKSGAILNRDNSVRNRYAKLEDLDVAVRKLLATHGFAFSFDSKTNDAGTLYTFSCELSHRDGHSEVKTLALPIDEGQSRNRVQSIGSSETYAKRRLIKMHLNIVERDEDDDGNGGADPATPAQIEAVQKDYLDMVVATSRAAPGTKEGDELLARFFKYMRVTKYEELLARDIPAAHAFIAEKRRTPPK